ncbi:MAG: 50S ribosomal protein L25 [Oligoflexia bacterium]|nr:50S ribosomal protein L25 [Oligoflexia bacterium]
MNFNTLNLKTRNLDRKSKKMRSLGIVPGIVYGKNISNIPVKMTMAELYRALKEDGEVYQIETEKGEILVKFESIQRDPLSRRPIHFSLTQLERGNESEIQVPVNLKGIPEGVKKGGTLVVIRDDLTVSATPKNMPEEIKGNIEDLDIGEKLTVGDLKVPKKVDVVEDDELVVAVCKPPTVVEEEVVEEGFQLAL